MSTSVSKIMEATPSQLADVGGNVLEFTSVGLLQDGAVLALTQQALTRRGQSSGGHGGHLEPRALWSVSPDCL